MTNYNCKSENCGSINYEPDDDFKRMCSCGHCWGCHRNNDCKICGLTDCFGAKLATIEDFWKELNDV